MTMEAFSAANMIISEMDRINDEMSSLRHIMDNDTKTWRMEVRPNMSNSLRLIDHCGLLPEFLEAVYKKQLEKYESLKKELEEL